MNLIITGSVANRSCDGAMQTFESLALFRAITGQSAGLLIQSVDSVLDLQDDLAVDVALKFGNFLQCLLVGPGKFLQFLFVPLPGAVHGGLVRLSRRFGEKRIAIFTLQVAFVSAGFGGKFGFHTDDRLVSEFCNTVTM